MELLRRIFGSTLPPLLDGRRLVGVQHFLETTESLLAHLVSTQGLRFRDVELVGKPYSAIPAVQQSLVRQGCKVTVPTIPRPGDYRATQQACIRRVVETMVQAMPDPPIKHILLDEGGDLIGATGHTVRDLSCFCGIEQTRSGLPRALSVKFPVIQVADSALKRHLEPPLIAREVLTAISQRPALARADRFGVIGVGVLGSSLVEQLCRTGRTVWFFDTNSDTAGRVEQMNPSAVRCSTPDLVLRSAGVVLGSTGKDCLASVDAADIGRAEVRHFASCSSGDYEFLSLLRMGDASQIQDPPRAVNDIQVDVGRHELTVHNGGFPINFNREHELSAPEDIQLTRALLGGAIVQAAALLGRRRSRRVTGIMLSPGLQMAIARNWLELRPERRGDYSKEVLAGVSDRNWIVRNSGGSEIGIPLGFVW